MIQWWLVASAAFVYNTWKHLVVWGNVLKKSLQFSEACQYRKWLITEAAGGFWGVSCGYQVEVFYYGGYLHKVERWQSVAPGICVLFPRQEPSVLVCQTRPRSRTNSRRCVTRSLGPRWTQLLWLCYIRDVNTAISNCEEKLTFGWWIDLSEFRK